MSFSNPAFPRKRVQYIPDPKLPTRTRVEEAEHCDYALISKRMAADNVIRQYNPNSDPSFDATQLDAFDQAQYKAAKQRSDFYQLPEALRRQYRNPAEWLQAQYNAAVAAQDAANAAPTTADNQQSTESESAT